MDNSASYLRSSESGVYMREGYAGIPYSDGGELESRMLGDVIACTDVSDSSPELRGRITDWPSEYHFSPLRANLLRPFSFKGKRVLELGCGCGALTRFLGESGADVVAVEGSPRRAAIAAARCRDLPNVRVYCDNIAGFGVDNDFEVVTLIGVLEYARVFFPSTDDAVQRCLQIARGFLADDGELYLAIENQLGLKYFNGCSEDHTGIPYFGIHDCYTEQGVVTFGKKELAGRLQAAGFTNTEFFFPFPDYKLPELILSEQALAHPDLCLGDLLCHANSRDYGKPALQAFHEGLAWRGIARNGLVGDLANSFLVRASKKVEKCPADWYAHTYAAGRLREYATENVIFQKDGALQVSKRNLFNGADAGPSPRIRHVIGTQSYVSGTLYIVDLQRMMANGDGMDAVTEWARPWLKFLRENANERGQLPGEFIDCIPTNLICGRDRQFHYIDAEWQATSEIPLVWVAVRGLIISSLVSPMPTAFESMTYRCFAAAILDDAGIAYTDRDWEVLAEWEDSLRMMCYGRFRDPVGFADRLNLKVMPRPVFLTIHNVLNQAEAEIKRVKGTVSWKVTKPLRFIYNMFRKIVGVR
jgi:SAM-dependent methyltransferase